MRTFKLLAISDVHLGHNKTETTHIISNLKTIINIDVLSEIDMLVIAGDLFDHAIGYSDDDTYQIQQWLVLLLSLCSTYKVSLRILEGTPLHDRGQSKNIEVLNQATDFDIDLLYVDRVWIEKNKKYSLNILYVPDEWHPDTDQTWLDVMEELSFNGLETVDLSIMHGMFEHQVPSGCLLKPHINSRYEGITDGYIIVGHIHQPTFKGKIIAPGSFDRLIHGDEGKKGCWRIDLSKDGKNDKIIFIENKNAKDYITIDCSGLAFDSAIEMISVLKVKPKAYLRLRTCSTDNALALLEWCKKEYFSYNWTLQILDKDIKKRDKMAMIYKPTEIIGITPNSLSSLLAERMRFNGNEETVVAHGLKMIEEIK